MIDMQQGVFNWPEMRESFQQCYGKNVAGAKFKIGQVVVFKATMFDPPAEWTGKVQAVNCTVRNNFEYLIEGAPVLAWEEQLTAKS